MSNDFEKRVSQQMDGFQLSPGPQVWERVAAALPEKRRRRFAIWWWLPLAACLCGGIWLLIDKQNSVVDKRAKNVSPNSIAENGSLKKLMKPASIDTVENDLVQQNNKTKDSLTKKDNSVQQTADVNRKEVVANDHYQKTKTYKKLQQADKITVTPEAEIPMNENVLLKKHSQTSAKQTEDVDDVLHHAAGNAAIQKAITSDLGSLIMEPILPLAGLTISPLPPAIVKMDTALPVERDTLLRTAVTIKAPEVKSKNKHPEWSLTMAFGKSSLSNSMNESQKLFANAYFLNSGGITSGGQAGNNGTFRNPSSGFSFNAGIMRSQAISTHFSWQAGLNYQLLTSKQRVGSRNDSLANADASTGVAFYTNNRIGNATGQSASTFSSNSSNKVHRLQVVSGIRYTLNTAKNLPVSFSAGASIAYNISNNLLLHDYRSYSYIRSPKLSNKFMLGGQAGVDVFINHKIHAGIFYQHDFTNVAKAKVGSVFRWNQLQLRMAIPFSKH